ncbi:similar to RIKEN cDNA 5033414D02 (predicted), isoform CRA_c [Rattus norvegicus]|uniref:Similar to RIKEN cDNA 5033414D02 (Predicted), isoform CRA_c n=1 Tax=Rattus norvegicus TaxID=10116 RepID=A6I0V9_RAT|nr:similar to RIKEN cDNA 5033414D02 (predicted), isoform CRA_c [Rattus norvegicus]
MGFIFSKSMNENMKNQQEFMVMHARLQVKLKTYWKQKRQSWSCQKDSSPLKALKKPEGSRVNSSQTNEVPLILEAHTASQKHKIVGLNHGVYSFFK